MSRIHEALRRAEQERAASQTAQEVEVRPEPASASRLVDPAPPANISTTAISHPAILPHPKKETIVETLRFEDIWANCAHPRWRPDPNLLVFSSGNPSHLGMEQFRTLRSRLYRMRDSQRLQTVLISSSIMAEGKTLIATNLAHALVRQEGCRVLLIDADLRSPRVHALLGAPSTPGLADYLQNTCNEFQVIQAGDEEGLCFIPAGAHVTHPSELISSERTKQFLERIKPAFDWIIIDSPPALPVADSSVLGAMCDGVLFVVRANSTPSEVAQKACKELKDTHILGVVLNTVEPSSEYGSYYSNEPYGLVSTQNPKK